MTELYQVDSAVEAFNDEVQEACRCSQEIHNYKAENPMYKLLRSRNGFSVVYGDYSKAMNLGLVDSAGKITDAGLEFLSARYEL